MTALFRTLAIALALGSVGCPPAANGSPGSCTRTDGRCFELGRGHLETEYPDNCAYPSVYSTLSCPVENRVGRCDQTSVVSGMVSVLTVHYYQPETTGHAESDCLAAGMSVNASRSSRFFAE